MQKIKPSLRITACLLVFAMLFGLVPIEGILKVFAADKIVYVKDKNGNSWDYSNMEDAWDKVNNVQGTMGLYNDVKTHRLNVWKGGSLVIELNGYVLSRGLDSSEKEGEVIKLEDNAKLTVYGGSKSNPSYGSYRYHTVKAFDLSTRNDHTFKGGLITGGYSYKSAGGIVVRENCRLELVNTTVAGNCADTTIWHSSLGYGGGVYLDNDYATVSGINFWNNRADGGGLYLDDEHICVSNCNFVKNIADDDGGGICNKNDFNTIENCTVYNNESKESKGGGGGV